MPVLKEVPAEAQVISHRLMLRSGMIRQQASGVYSWLPFGLRALQNIIKVITRNMSKVGSLEMLMPCIQPASLWLESGRFENYGKEMLKFQDRHDNTLLFGPTNEDMITDVFRHNIQSYKDLPKNLYHIQWKFRDEIRPRFGVMRAREFLMKDAYSFDIDQAGAHKSYNQMYLAYLQTFHDMGLHVIPVVADSGVIGGDLSHEFHILAEHGESTIFYDKRFLHLSASKSLNMEEVGSLYAVAEEKHDFNNGNFLEDEIASSKSIEIGHIFYIGTKYSKAMKAVVNDSNGNLVPVEMCSYGIGISRLVAAIIEANHDEKGIIWPSSVAPFTVSILNLNMSDDKCNELSKILYDQLLASDVSVLYDDTEERAGSKFATHDLIGSPYQLIIGSKKGASDIVEVKNRKTGKIEELDINLVMKLFLND
ncbi:Proline--tRNA ligase [Pseudolycoriella hygida]|uniref:Probable proline--tRNA ligase, mitochondrial n=1 Tax=Pseudolycoriella hygida TaxID=35572 RepID=A0A9Q0N744_9DIPT|nr:Proline--tRNA ligase [Pseudolycoriella hygida]